MSVPNYKIEHMPLDALIAHANTLQQERSELKQRELELLAVIEAMKNGYSNKACNEVPPGNGYCDKCAEGLYEQCRYVSTSSQALREHEAKVLEEAAKFFDGESYTTRDENSCVMDFAENQLRRMAEERRKK